MSAKDSLLTSKEPLTPAELFLTAFQHHPLKMPISAKCSQDAFQMKIVQILEGLDGVIAIHDDITI